MTHINVWRRALVSVLIFVFIFSSPFAALAQEAESSPAPSEVYNSPDPNPLEPAESPIPNETPSPEEVFSSPEASPETSPESSPETSPESSPEPEKTEEVEPELLSLEGTTYRDDSRDVINGLRLDTESLTGALSFEFSIAVPPGRNNLTPDIKLRYTSQPSEQVNVFGYGWSDNIPYIERLNRKGTDKLYTENFFYSSLDGELKANDTSPTTESYGAKVDSGSFLKYEYKNNNKWLVTDKTGTTYKFGYTSASQQNDLASSTKIFKWMLEEIRDRNDNYIKYEYFKDVGQIYPSKIIYTGSGVTDGIFELEFLRESRTDKATSTRSAFTVGSNYRINEIKAKINGTWVRKYTLSYSTGSNGRRSVLASITESGQDENSNIITLPPTTFAYQTSGTEGWTHDDTVTAPQPFVGSLGRDMGVRALDVDGDSLTDVMVSGPNGTTTQNKTYIRTDSGWQEEAAWANPDSSLIIDSSIRDSGIRLADVNADGLVDVLVAENNSHTKVSWINNGNGWTQNATWESPEYFSDISSGDKGVRLVDVNGDGLTDIIKSTTNDAYATSSVSYINNGAGWTSNSNWNSPQPFLRLGKDYGVRFADIDGDSLVDVISDHGIYLNNGNGWTLNSNWALPTGFDFTDGGVDRGVRLYDVNGDGLPDITMGCGCAPLFTHKTYINTGIGWIQDEGWNLVESVNMVIDNGKDNGVRIFDLNGDGMDDLVHKREGSWDDVHLNNSKKVDLLWVIGHSQGATSTITYKASALYKDGSTLLNPDLPHNYDTVERIQVNDGLGTISTNAYIYEGGDNYYSSTFDRRPAGFNKITKIDSASSTVKTFYHQGNTTNSSQGESPDSFAKIGRAYRVEVADSSGNIYLKIVNNWATTTLSNGREFVKLAKKTNLSYDGDSDHKDKAEEYTYSDTTGNLLQKKSWGEVTASDDGTFSDTGTDKFTTDWSYAASTTPYIVGLPSQETTVNQSSSKVKESKFYYDTLSFNNVSKGNLTKEERWVVGSSYIDYEKTYNSYGLVTQDKDPRDLATNYTHDSFNLYVSTSTNPLSQTTVFTYDYSLGKPKQAKDPNSLVFQTVYDALDRVKEEKQPDITTPSTLVTKTAYTYTDAGLPRTTQKTDYLNSATSTDTYVYVDGLGRPVQERKEAEAANTFAVNDTAYNNLGLKYRESLPYFSTGSARTSPTATTKLYATYAYDPLYRVKAVGNAVGTTTNVYDDWKTTTTDTLGKYKDLYKDAYGNLVRVDEHYATSTYTTLYQYNGLGNLTKITDALNNVRNFTYDGLGRRLTSEDLHPAADASFAKSTFVYDNAGNLEMKVSGVYGADLIEVDYSYDNLNRVLFESSSSVGEYEIAYKYDTCTTGIGRLCFATSSSETGFATTEYQYDALGNVQQEKMKTGTSIFNTTFDHDRLGNQTLITYPDNSKVAYTYNSAGQMEQVAQKPSTGSFTTFLTDIDYTPLGQVTYKGYNNGVETLDEYNADELYRLARKLTMHNEGAIHMDARYTYDSVGNITEISDLPDTSAYKIMAYTYDDLHRLTSASSTLILANGSSYKHEFAYNAIGNMTYKSDKGTYAYSGTGLTNPHAVTGIGTTTYAYDTWGNMVSSNAGLSNIFDYRNLMTQSSLAGRATTTYLYDHDGNRVRYVAKGTTTLFANKLYNVQGATTTRHIFAGNELVATVETKGATTNIYYIHTDHLGGSSVVTDSTGMNTVEVTDYHPYGTMRMNEHYVTNFSEQRKFTGHEYDQETGFNYMGARYQDPRIGRFISQDPLFLALGDEQKVKNITRKSQQEILSDPQMLNSYAYARNNPLIYVDQDGQFSFSIMGAFPESTQATIGNWANNYATQNSAFDYATSHSWVANTAGGVGIAAGAGAGILYGGSVLGIQALQTLGSTCIAFCSQADNVMKTLNNTNQLLGPARDSISQTIQDQKLQNIFNNLYKAKDEFPGGTAGAIKYTQETGKLIGDSTHLQKGIESITALNRVLQNVNLSQTDRAIGQTLLNQLKSVVK
ncbi:FG-GAP-like repeat-containing protein [Candidatus Parcubacteria bacterium]|nr:FG-GAP-like repeat-containing protein [Candidatus Parcubacteria bacterium]